MSTCHVSTVAHITSCPRVMSILRQKGVLMSNVHDGHRVEKGRRKCVILSIMS